MTTPLTSTSDAMTPASGDAGLPFAVASGDVAAGACLPGVPVATQDFAPGRGCAHDRSGEI